MNRICIHKPTRKLLEFQSGKSKETGTLIKNAINAGYLEEEVEEILTTDDRKTILIKYETKKEKTARQKREIRATNIKDARKVIADKYKGKKKSDITNTDATEWDKLKMAQELGIEL